MLALQRPTSTLEAFLNGEQEVELPLRSGYIQAVHSKIGGNSGSLQYRDLVQRGLSDGDPFLYLNGVIHEMTGRVVLLGAEPFFAAKGSNGVVFPYVRQNSPSMVPVFLIFFLVEVKDGDGTKWLPGHLRLADKATAGAPPLLTELKRIAGMSAKDWGKLAAAAMPLPPEMKAHVELSCHLKPERQGQSTRWEFRCRPVDTDDLDTYADADFIKQYNAGAAAMVDYLEFCQRDPDEVE